MLNVLLVDDEFIVRQGLKAMINWDDYKMNVLLEANNGKDALALLEEHQIDVIVTDIRMPLMDGIELTRKAKESYPDMKVMLLTCYDDFEYVQEAVALGASGYLLKTDLEGGSLEKQLQKIAKEVQQEREKRESYQRLEVKARESAALIKEKQIKSILKGGEPQPIHQELSWLLASHLILKIVFARPVSLKNVERAFYRLFDKNISFLFQMEDLSFLALTGFPADLGSSQQKILEWKARMAGELFAELNELEGSMNLYEGMSFQLETLCKTYQSLCSKAEAHCFYNGFGHFVSAETIGSAEFEPPVLDFHTLHQLTIMRDWVHLKAQCEEIFLLFETEQTDVETVKMATMTMVETVMLGLKSNSNLHTKNWGSNSLDYKEKVKALQTFQDVKNWFYHGLEKLEDSRLQFIGGSHHVIRQAVSFIEQNYAKDLTLEELSREVGLSKSYVSTMFKKGTGKSFVEYLNDVRLEKAKELFLHSELKIFEVAEKVGFHDPKYFSKQFKRMTGMSPNRFRSIYLQ
ncbi:response regulator [Alkalihalobacillus oceani]|uniref:Response regulator n=1 Tax=Halalkalibacter oceani TaxID=1653776 RepID=A0A9X2DLV2_9BACI|nr:response regulator [Halalkalibacter oceani]MCM3712502.1 response regulator [Halalkalibacter oceani]